MPAPSLKALAKKVLVKNIAQLTQIGGAPYDLIRPVLLRMENPDQLRLLEEDEPELEEEDSELWEKFIRKNIQDSAKKLERLAAAGKKPSYEIWRSWTDIQQASLEKDMKALQKSMADIENNKQQAIMVDPKYLPKPPKETWMKGERGQRRQIRRIGPDASVLRFNSGSKTKTLTGKGVMEKARREAKEMRMFSGKKHVLATPTHQLASRASAVTKAPKSLINNQKIIPALDIKKTLDLKRSTVKVPRPTTQASSSGPKSSPQKVAEKPSLKRAREDDNGNSNASTKEYKGPSPTRPPARQRTVGDPFMKPKRRRLS